MAVEKFRGVHYFLSNMYPVQGGIEVGEGIIVPTTEHAYQAAKFDSTEIRKVILASEDGVSAKEMAQKYVEMGVPKRSDWDEVKLGVMRDLVSRKFAPNSRVAHLLISTGDEELIEGNTWGDTFWGVSPPGSGDGENWLGCILMETRARLANKEEK
ncbi:MAG: NADAR family protein [Candidatus Saccharimonadales bacterium]